MHEEENSFSELCFGRKERGKGEASVVFSFFFFYYQKELGAISTNKQTSHLALLHL